MLLIKNFTRGRTKPDEKFLQRVEKKCLKEIGVKNKTEISLVICNKKKIREINRLYRKKDKITDVLSFGGNRDGFVTPPDKTAYMGEIFICLPVAERQAKNARHSPEKEMAQLLTHGILHLAGYDHKKTGVSGAGHAKKMRELEKAILEKINFYV